MNIEYLKTYLEVIKLGSFSEVAKRMSISQPAVSFQIQKLERDLGVRLLDRSQKTITLTDAGKRLLRFAETVDREQANLIYDLEQIREEVTGDIIITASTIPGEILILPILGGFKALHPGIGAHVDISDSISVISGVQKGSYDIGFCGIKPEDKELEYFKFAEDEIVLIVFPGHPFALRKRVTLHEIQPEQLIFREVNSGTRQSLITLMAEAGMDIEKWAPSMVLSTHQAVVTAVEEGLGIAFVSNLAIRKSIALGLVKQVEVEGLQLRRDFYCIYSKERVVSRLLNEFIAFVQSGTVQA